MTQLSIQEFRRKLSLYLAQAEAGESFVITRRGRPIVRISSIAMPGVSVGKHFGKGSIRPAISGGLEGRSLEILDEDRRDRFEDWNPSS